MYRLRVSAAIAFALALAGCGGGGGGGAPTPTVANAAAANAVPTSAPASPTAAPTSLPTPGALTGVMSLVAQNAAAAASLPALYPSIYHAKDFGAACDGSTVDTQSLQNGINAAAGKAQFVIDNTGSNCVTGFLSIPSNSQIEIDGTLYLASGSNSDVLGLASGASNILIHGSGTINGNAAGQTSGPTAGINAEGGINGVGIGPSSVKIQGITITNAQDWPVNLAGTNVYLSNVTMTNSAHSAEFVGCTQCWADQIHVSGIGDQAFSFYGGDVNSGISNSYVANSLQGIGVFSDSAQPGLSNGITIVGNTITGIQISSSLYLFNASGTGTESNVTAADNQIYSNQTTCGSGCSGFDVYVQNVSNAMLTEDQIHSSGAVGNAGICGIALGNTSYITVENEEIWDEGVGGNGTGICLIAGNVSSNLSISGNQTWDNQSKPTMTTAIAGTAGPAPQVANNQWYGLADLLSASTTVAARVR